jgi:peroxiredoxin
MKMKTVIAGLTVLALTGWQAFADAEVGKPAPDFTGKDIHGKTHSLADYKGRIVVLESYNLDCPYVANHYNSGAMQELQAEATGKGVVWLTVNSVNAESSGYRSPEQAGAEWNKAGMKATAWIDDSAGKIGKLYGMRTTPHLFVIDEKGVLAYAGAIDDRPEAKGDPRETNNHVRAALRDLQANQPVKVAETKPYGCGVKY